MLISLHVRRWSLGGTFAVIAGLAASAEPLAPMTGTANTPVSLASISNVESTGFEPPSTALDWEAPRQPMAVAPARPRARALASVPVEVVVQHGAPVRPEARPIFTAEAKWDGIPEGEEWSEAAMRAIDAAPNDLTEIVPDDIDSWCPGYERNPRHLRAAFWVGTVSAIARYESTFNEDAVGGGGAWHGLLQISPATARAYRCEATSAEALSDGDANIACAIRIMSRTVSRDGVVTADGGGIAADWGPMSREGLRSKIREWVSGQSYCKASGAVWAALVPPVRPTREDSYAVASLSLDPRLESAALRKQ